MGKAASAEFFELLARALDRDHLIALIADRGHADPYDILLSWLIEHSRVLWDGLLGARELQLLEPAIRGADLDSFLRSLKGNHDAASVDSQRDDLELLFHALRHPAQLRSLFCRPVPRYSCDLVAGAKPDSSRLSSTGEDGTDGVGAGDERPAAGVFEQAGDLVPEAIRERVAHTEVFASRRPLVWVEHPGTEMMAPYWPDEACIEAIRSLQRGAMATGALPLAVRRALRRSEILATENWARDQAENWRMQCERGRAELAESGYTVLRDLLPRAHLQTLRGYLEHLYANGYMAPGPRPAERRDVLHNQPVLRFLHHQLVRLIQRLVAAPIKPSYSFLSRYREGAVLSRHVDREQCAWNLSVVLDQDPEPGRDRAWPIHFDVQGSVHTALLGIGDGVLYSGTDIPHWRDALPLGQRVTVGIFHFVDREFAGSLD